MLVVLSVKDPYNASLNVEKLIVLSICYYHHGVVGIHGLKLVNFCGKLGAGFNLTTCVCLVLFPF